MRYYHRTSTAPDEVVAEVARYFSERMTPVIEEPRRRQFSSPIGIVTVTVEVEGGHYTLVTVDSDQVTESELDKFSKRFLSRLHMLADPDHALRGAY